jgi:hypothetical protein
MRPRWFYAGAIFGFGELSALHKQKRKHQQDEHVVHIVAAEKVGAIDVEVKPRREKVYLWHRFSYSAKSHPFLPVKPLYKAPVMKNKAINPITKIRIC